MSSISRGICPLPEGKNVADVLDDRRVLQREVLIEAADNGLTVKRQPGPPALLGWLIHTHPSTEERMARQGFLRQGVIGCMI